MIFAKSRNLSATKYIHEPENREINLYKGEREGGKGGGRGNGKRLFPLPRPLLHCFFPDLPPPPPPPLVRSLDLSKGIQVVTRQKRE